MESALYFGSLRHCRFIEPQRKFTYALFMAYLDLAELDTVFAGRAFWSTKGPNLAWFRRADHYGPAQLPLDEAIRRLVEERTGSRPGGPIRLLTHLRYFGYCFNPVSFYYCFARDGRSVETVVAEVNNTPWGERHMYVLPRASADLRFEFAKAFHVSPFLGMNMDYVWRFGEPGEQLWSQMENRQGGARVFEAALTLERRPISRATLARTLAGYPAMTVKVVAAIYVEALRLWLRRAKFYPHPDLEKP